MVSKENTLAFTQCILYHTSNKNHVLILFDSPRLGWVYPTYIHTLNSNNMLKNNVCIYKTTKLKRQKPQITLNIYYLKGAFVIWNVWMREEKTYSIIWNLKRDEKILDLKTLKTMFYYTQDVTLQKNLSSPWSISTSCAKTKYSYEWNINKKSTFT